MIGHILVIIGPSCSGKDTVVKRLCKDIPGIIKVPEYTTREIRPYEVDGIDHRFVSEEEMDKLTTIDKRKYRMMNSIGEYVDVYYANALESFDNDSKDIFTYILITTLEGLNAFNKVEIFKDKIIPIFLNANADTRAERYEKRLKESVKDPEKLKTHMLEMMRRIKDDDKQFMDVLNKSRVDLHIIDANRPLGQVVTDIKHIITDNIHKEEAKKLAFSVLNKINIKRGGNKK